uniref:CRAL-TRIO domain-containing protein n=1 Tax=Amblyomma maculatum TaxID=34609 RepID=G3MTJ7_AMBMU
MRMLSAMDVEPLPSNVTAERSMGRHREWGSEEIPLDSVAEESLAMLGKLLEDEPELKALADSADVLRFLRLRKYDVEAALDTLRKYCAIRTSAPRLFEGLREPEKMRKLTQDLITVLPRRNLHGRPVIVYKVGAWQPSKASYLQMTQALVMCLEHVSRHPAAQTAGVSLVSDFHGWSLGSMRFVDLSVTREYLHYLQYCAPILANEAHVIRQPTAFNFFYALVKPFMKDETIKSIRFHGKHVHGVYEDIPPSMLSADYGGTAPSSEWELFWTDICKEHHTGSKS